MGLSVSVDATVLAAVSACELWTSTSTVEARFRDETIRNALLGRPVKADKMSIRVFFCASFKGSENTSVITKVGAVVTGAFVPLVPALVAAVVPPVPAVVAAVIPPVPCVVFPPL